MDMNKDTSGRLREIEDGVYHGDIVGIRDNKSLRGEVTEVQSLIEALNRGMERARAGLKNVELSVPEFLLAMDAYREGLNLITLPDHRTAQEERRVLIGVVEGEVHDLGKNIVAAVLEISGFKVINQGELNRDRTLEAIKEHRPSIVALSAMMSTCVPAMQDTVTWVRKLYPEVRIMVGGAALDADLAAFIGAHGFADSAVTAPDAARSLIDGQ
jgi:5-methyltetrahydrofolate--homocysteine methyltransferase